MHKSKMDNSFEAYWEPNADNHWLRPIGNVGHVWEVNGSGARELSDFHPTRHELITLVKYWAETAIEEEYKMLLHSDSRSLKIRRWSFALARVGRICRLLGQEGYEALDELASPSYLLERAVDGRERRGGRLGGDGAEPQEDEAST